VKIESEKQAALQTAVYCWCWCVVFISGEDSQPPFAIANRRSVIGFLFAPPVGFSGL
jgi:hypothetical protein